MHKPADLLKLSMLCMTYCCSVNMCYRLLRDKNFGFKLSQYRYNWRQSSYQPLSLFVQISLFILLFGTIVGDFALLGSTAQLAVHNLSGGSLPKWLDENGRMILVCPLLLWQRHSFHSWSCQGQLFQCLVKISRSLAWQRSWMSFTHILLLAIADRSSATMTLFQQNFSHGRIHVLAWEKAYLHFL